jgi:type IX secretion system PorP/SprF family membrane protein
MIRKSTNGLLAFTLMMFYSFTVRGQYDAMFTQYMFNEMFINPAYAGSKEAMSATLLHRQQWVSFPGRPVTTSFSLHGPLMNNKMGVGLSVLNEKIGVLNRNLIYGSYSYRIKLNDRSALAMGLMAGLENQSNKLGTLKVSNDINAAPDPQFAQNSPNVSAPNAGAGLFYSTRSLYIGASVPRLIDNQVKFSTTGSTIRTTAISAEKFTYYFTGGYVFDLSENIKLRTNVMVKAVQNSPSQIDLGGNFLFSELIWAGISYRSNSSMSALLGVQASKQLFMCYSYDYGLNAIQKYSQGSHELVLSYLFSFTGRKVVTPRYF